ncbi:MAG: OmpA family protein [Pseudomonadota bacterium]
MCNWKAWIWPGILTVAILSALALWMKTDAIEADLQTKATAALAERSQSWAQVFMDGRDATITGEAPSEAAQSEAEFITDEAYSVRVVDNQTGLMAAQSPYTFTASRQANAIELTGFVPDEATRATILASARDSLPGMRVTDNTEFARGAPEGFAALSGFAIAQLRGLDEGSASTTDSELSVQGMANTLEDFDEINTALASPLPGGGTLGAQDVRAPEVSPYTWQTDYDGQKATLSGFVPDTAAAEALVSAAKEALPDAEIVDEQRLASGAIDGFSNDANFALAQLPAFSSGSVSLSDKTLNVRGNSRTPQEYAASRLALMADRLPQGVTIGEQDIKVAAVSPYTWQAAKTPDGLALSGYVPTDEARAAVVASAEKTHSGIAITDNMQIASGAPDEFTDQTSFALGQLSQLTSGSVALSGADYFVKGQASSVEAYEAVTTTATGDLPASLALGAVEIEPATQTPYTWGAQYTGEAVTLSGFVPNQESREEITAAAAAALPDVSVTDEMRIAAGNGVAFASDADFALKQLSNFNEGEVGLSDRALSINGTARTPDSYDAANQALAGQLPDGMSVAEQAIELPTVSPYTWGADYDGDTVSLSGFVPNDETRSQIIADAKASLPNATVDDKMRDAAGSGEAFGAHAGFAVKQLSALNTGRASLSDQALTVEGVAKDPSGFALINSALTTGLATGLGLARENITPPTISPYTWGADYDGETVALNGSVPNEESRAAITAAARESLPEAQVQDNMQLALGAPAEFDRNGAFALSQLSNFSNGSVSLTDTDLSVEGVSRDVDAFDTSRAALNDLPDGMSLANQNIRPSTVSPYTWSAAREGAAVSLSGFVPSAEVKRTIADGVKRAMPDATITDNTRVAAGAPNGFDSDVAFATDQLAKLQSGNVSLEDRQMEVVGQAATVGDFARVNAQLASLPAGATLRKGEIKPATVSPYSWGAGYDGKTVTLSGFVPSEQTRAQIRDAAGKRLRGATVQDEMQIAGGAPDGFAASATSAVGLLPRLKSGNVALSNSNLTVQGEAKDGGNYTAALSTLESRLPSTVNVTQANIAPPMQEGDYTFEARKTTGSIVLAGQAPSKETRLALGQQLKDTYLNKTVVNRLTVAGGAPQAYNESVDKGLGILRQLSTGTAKLVNGDLTVDGQAGSVAAYDGIIAAKGDVPGTIEPASIRPYSWGVDNTGDSTLLSGFVPSEGVSNATAAAARATLGKGVTNQQRIAGGAPEGFGNAQAALISGVNQLENGRATLTDTSAFVQGRANSEEDASRIGDSIAASLPGNYKLRRQISYLLPLPETPVELKEEFKPEPVPDPIPEVTLKKEFVPKPVEEVEPEAVEDEPTVVAAADATDGAADEDTDSSSATQTEAQDETSTATPSTTDEQTASSTGTNTETQSETASAPDTASATEEQAPAVCNVDFAALFEGESILFDTAKADIKPASFALLDRLAEGLSQCTTSQIEIGGHTDSRGSASYNQALSEARAQLVLAYLSQKDGVNAANLTAKGYGETTPIVSNSGPERSKNRRIEFKVIGE